MTSQSRKRPRAREDPITLEEIEPRHLYTINKQPYNVRSLAKSLLVKFHDVGQIPLPHSRREPRYGQLRKIHTRLPNSILKNHFGQLVDAFEPPPRQKRLSPTRGKNVITGLHGWNLDTNVRHAVNNEEQLSLPVKGVRAGDTITLVEDQGWGFFGHVFFDSRGQLFKSVILTPTVRGILEAAHRVAAQTGHRGLTVAKQPMTSSFRRVTPERVGLDKAYYPRVWKLLVK